MTPPRRPRLWRNPDADADSPAFRAFLQDEFPAVARLAEGPERREVLRLMAASFALAGLSGCGDGGDARAQEDGRAQEVPYVTNPEHLQPGSPLHYARVALLDGHANGVLVTTFNGRPIKVEGNGGTPGIAAGPTRSPRHRCSACMTRSARRR